MSLGPFVEAFITHFELQVADDVVPKLTHHIDALIFNIVAIACLVAKLNDRKIITPEHIAAVEKYVDSRCTTMNPKKLSGGMVTMPSDFYGYPHPNYSTTVPESTHMETLNFTEGIARPALGPPLEYRGGAKKHNDVKILDAHVRQILAFHQMKISKEGKDELDKVLKKHMRCFAKYLTSNSKTKKVTEAKLGQALKQKQFHVFL